MPVGLRDRRTWRRRGPPARTLVTGTDACYWHQRALSAPARVVDMSARYIPLAVSTTPSQCRQRASVSATPSQCRQPTPVSATPSQCRQRAPTPVPGECPSPASDCSSEGLCPPRAWGFPREAESTTGCLGCLSCSGDALFFVAVGGTKRKMPPRVWGLPVPVPASGERPHAPGLAGPGGRRGRPGGGTPARARAGPRSGFPQVVRHPWGTRTRTLIYRTRTAHKGAIPPLCAAPCSLIPFLVCDTEKERGQDPRGTRRTGHSCCTA